MQQSAKIQAANGSISELCFHKGSAAHPYWQAAQINISSLDSIDIADFAHFLCILHGRHPGVIDYAANKTTDERTRQWLVTAMDGFAKERAFLTRLTVAAGPIQGVTADEDSSKVIHAHGHALEMLAQSDRKGTAMGAALALAIEWYAIRDLLDAVAVRIGMEPVPCSLPEPTESDALARNLSQDETIERALLFGAKQLLLQHRGIWTLLAARQQARAEEF